MNHDYSSAFLRVPNSTQLPASIRPPIHNPYDKFTQPQFDEWIGNITSTLRRALGQEEEAPTLEPAKSRGEDAGLVSDADEDSVEDSFAEWKAMRTREKGKMRATGDEQDSEYGGSREDLKDSSVQGYAVGDAPEDVIELLSDDDDVERGEPPGRGGYSDEDHDGNLMDGSSLAGSDGEVERSYVGGPQHAMSSKPHRVFANATEQQGS